MAVIPATGEEHTHSFGNAWKSDGTLHWKECACGEKDDFEPHTPGEWIIDLAATAMADGSKHKECTVCGYTVVTEVIPATGAEHTHVFGSAWLKDASGHWHVCACGVKGSFAAHVLGDWIVDVAATTTTAGSKHKECTVCGFTTATEEIPATGERHIHSFGSAWLKNATGHWYECTCGEKGSFATHTPGNWIVDIAATATKAGSKHKECTVCAFTTVTEVIPASGENHTHSFGLAWTKSATDHWHECACGAKDGFATHTPGDWIVDDAATATKAGSKHKECTVCGYTTATEAIPVTGEGHTHSFGSTWVKNATGHWHECACGAKGSFATHTPGNWIVDVAATATKAGSRHIECTICSYTTATEVIPATVTTPVYKITGGTNQSWKKGTTAGVTITCDGDFGKFTELKIDGSVVIAANYTKKSGSTIITLNAAYLETLVVGDHTVEFVYSDGSAQTKLTLLAADNGPSDPTDPGGNNSNGNVGIPKTGERFSGLTIALIIILVLDMAFVILMAHGQYRKQKWRLC